MKFMKHNIKKDITGEQMQEDIPVIEIVDPYAYVHSNKIIAYVAIKGTNGKQRRKLLRTKKGGYLMS